MPTHYCKVCGATSRGGLKCRKCGADLPAPPPPSSAGSRRSSLASLNSPASFYVTTNDNDSVDLNSSTSSKPNLLSPMSRGSFGASPLAARNQNGSQMFSPVGGDHPRRSSSVDHSPTNGRRGSQALINSPSNGLHRSSSVASVNGLQRSGSTASMNGVSSSPKHGLQRNGSIMSANGAPPNGLQRSGSIVSVESSSAGGGGGRRGSMMMPEKATRRDSVAEKPTVAAVVDSVDCMYCEDAGRPSVGTVSKNLSLGTKDDRCEECRVVLGAGDVIYLCNVDTKTTEDGTVTRDFRCRRRLCQRCVDRSRERREFSRWHHHDPLWKTKLTECEGFGQLTFCAIVCHYHPCLGTVQQCRLMVEDDFATASGTEIQTPSCLDDLAFPYNSPALTTIVMLAGIPFMPVSLAVDIIGFEFLSQWILHKNMRERFGLQPPRFLPALALCGPCYAARVRRELTVRGYLQPYPLCGPDRAARANALPGPSFGKARASETAKAPRLSFVL